VAGVRGAFADAPEVEMRVILAFTAIWFSLFAVLLVAGFLRIFG
jgi:hypothetical protein